MKMVLHSPSRQRHCQEITFLDGSATSSGKPTYIPSAGCGMVSVTRRNRSIGGVYAALLAVLIAVTARAATVDVTTCTTPNGVQDNTAGIHTCAAQAGVGGTLLFPNGTYIVTGLQSLHADQTWLLDRLAELKKPLSTNQLQILENKAARLRIRGGTFRDTMGNASGHGIVSDGFDISLEDVKVIDARGWGIHTRNAFVEMSKVEIRDSLHGAYLHSATFSQRGPDLDRVRIYRTNLAKYGTSGGIHIHGVDGVWISETRIERSHVELPYGLGYAAVGIEAWHQDHPHIHGNEVFGGRISYSFYKTYWASITENAAFNAADYGYELALVGYSDISHNIGAGSATFGGVNYGVELSNASSHNFVTDNKLVGYTQAVREESGCVGNTIR